MTYYFTSIKEIWAVLVDSSKYFFSRISASILANTNTFVLGLTLGNTVVGYYSLAEKIYFALNSIYGPVNGAIFPYMTKNKNLELFKKILLWGIVGNILFLIAFYFVFPFIIPYVFHDFSKYSFTVMEILLLSSIVALPSTFLGYPFLASWGHPNFTNYSLIITSIMHVIILYVLYLFDSISIYSVAWLMCFSELFLLMYRIYGVKKYKLWK
jgi:PST family polysaccharide transporter